MARESSTLSIRTEAIFRGRFYFLTGGFPVPIGVWRSWLAHLLWEQRVVCSSHITPTLMPGALPLNTLRGFPLDSSKEFCYLCKTMGTADRQWNLRPAADQDTVSRLSAELGVDRVLA